MYKNIYIVDDDEVSIFLTETILMESNLVQECSTFTEAQLALQQLLTLVETDCVAQFPEVVFLDLDMPIITGWDFLEPLIPYEEAIKANTKIYILTSSVNEQERERAAEIGLITGFIQKPLEEVQFLCLEPSC